MKNTAITNIVSTLIPTRTTVIDRKTNLLSAYNKAPQPLADVQVLNGSVVMIGGLTM